jgi:DNA-binding MarR family transcriptional regulator
MVMWLKFMRFVPPGGIIVGEFQRRSGLADKAMRTWLTRMSKWWGYVSVEPATEVVRPTSGGRKALETWQPLTGIIEDRWRERFGKDTIDRLRDSMQSLVERFDGDLPDHLLILGYDLLSKDPDRKRRAPAEADGSPACSLPALLSKALLAFAFEFESDGHSLAIGANVLRLVGEEGIRVRDIPRLSGISKEAAAMVIGRLEERGLASLKPESPGSRTKLLVLTPGGRHLREAYFESVRDIENRWQTRFGKDTISGLRSLLECLVGEPAAESSPLFRGLEPYPDGWRASSPKTKVLPHYPMVLHRGGFPDGS